MTVGGMEKYTVCGLRKNSDTYRKLCCVTNNNDTGLAENRKGINLQVTRCRHGNSVIVFVPQIDVDMNDCGGIHVDDRPIGRKFHVILIDHLN